MTRPLAFKIRALAFAAAAVALPACSHDSGSETTPDKTEEASTTTSAGKISETGTGFKWEMSCSDGTRLTVDNGITVSNLPKYALYQQVDTEEHFNQEVRAIVLPSIGPIEPGQVFLKPEQKINGYGISLTRSLSFGEDRYTNGGEFSWMTISPFTNGKQAIHFQGSIGETITVAPDITTTTDAQTNYEIPANNQVHVSYDADGTKKIIFIATPPGTPEDEIKAETQDLGTQKNPTTLTHYVPDANGKTGPLACDYYSYEGEPKPPTPGSDEGVVHI